ncbi:DUF6232 family protein [Actinoplanes aureus]|uniref:Uncharacterized protein n=1 Tax=Actinoplanes aureus TaxID=2792083 RepID=A0A931CM41_9ACTN|nr:DUF6232 family protein [Actinoplanes aureus]MBG0567445.1 hypothetical protein [Actinoplanes aureus]
MELPVFYRGPRAVITHSVVEVAQTVRRRFLVAELFDVHIVRHDPEPDASGRQVFGVSALAAAVVSIPVVGSVSILLTALLVGVLVVYGTICVRPRRRRWWQVRAEYRGQVVEVFSSRDEREFAEFCRGLVRSLEFHDR